MSMDFDELNRISNNPSRVIATVFNDVESSFLAGAGTLNSGSHPFAYMVDLVVATNYGFISKLGDTEAKTFAVHARNIGDLSCQMSDDDWYGIYGDPAKTKIRFIISEETLKEVSVRFNEIDGNLNNSYRKLVIPPDTEFTIGGIQFLLENPVEIRVMDHGGYQVVYDSTRQSPLNPLITNTPDVEYIDIDRRSYMAIHLPVRQLAIKEHANRPSNIAVGLRETIQFTDSLYAVRAFITADGDTERNEMAVVFNNEIYDPNQPTLVVDMQTESSFEISIPSVYIQNGLGVGRVTILVYTTQGEYYRDLTTLKSHYHKAQYYDYFNDRGVLNTYEKPFKTINDVLIDSIEPITGGRNAAPFQEIKDLIIYGHRKRLIPVSNSDLSQFMLRNGYSSVKSIDFVTSRLYRVTKDLPLQEDKIYQDDSTTRFNSSIGTHVGSILTSLEEMIGTGWGIDNGSRMTLLQRSVFDITKQTPALILRHDFDTLMGSTNQTKIDTLADKTMVYNPFAYVFDTTRDRAVVRCYRVNKPTIQYQLFRAENVTLGLQVAVDQINTVADDLGYTITLQTKSSDAYKALDSDTLGIQLTFGLNDRDSPVTMKGKLLGVTAEKERIWEFRMPSRFDIDDTNEIDLAGFNQFGRPQDTVRVGLVETANFIFTYGGGSGALLTNSDLRIDQTLFDTTNIAIIETEYKMEFARPLESLYTRIRPMVGEAQYKKYTADVPEVYTKDEFKYENGKLVIVDGKAVLLHRKGDAMLDGEGKPIIRFFAGQTMYDDQDNPIPLEPRKMKYYFDFIGFDFNYMVSQDEYDTDYMNRIDDFFVDEVVSQLDAYNAITLDETKLVFKPRSTMGWTRVIIDESVERYLKTDLSFVVSYSLTKEGLRNENLKDNLTSSSHTIINNLLRQDTVSVDEIISNLRANAGTDLISVKVNMLAGSNNIQIITNVDTTNGFSVRKVIDQTVDRYLSIKEDIEVQFRKHLPEE